MDLKLLKHEVLYRGKVIDLIVDEVRYPSGKKGIREVASHPGGAVAAPLFDDGRILLVRQDRYPIGGPVLELPAGKLSPGEDPQECAGRELEEETGWRADRWEKLGSIYTTPGFCNEELHLYLATGLSESPHGHRRGEGEYSMTLHTFTLSETIDMIERGEIRDSKTVCAVLMIGRRMAGKV